MDKIRKLSASEGWLRQFGGKVRETRLRCLHMCRAETEDISDKGC